MRAFAADFANTGEDVFETGRELLTRLAGLRDLMTDHETTSVRLVVTPEDYQLRRCTKSLHLVVAGAYLRFTQIPGQSFFGNVPRGISGKPPQAA